MKSVAQQISTFQRKEIDYLFQHAQAVYKSKEFVILTSPCILSFGRILPITSRKVGNAPERNKLRRQTRAIFYQNQLFLHKFDAIIIFKSTAKSLSFQQIENIIIQAINRSMIKHSNTQHDKEPLTHKS